MDIRRRAQLGGIKKTSSGGGSTTGGSYTVNLNGQWEKTTAISNPDSTLYDGVYRSASNYNIHSGVAIMYITIKNCSSFKMYIRSYAESNFDYVMVSQLDKTITGSSSYSDTTLVKAHTRGNQQSGTALSSYTLVEYTGITSGEHTITVVYRKDSSGTHSGDDRGYVLIEKSQAGSGDSGEGGDDEDGGDIEIDTTYAIYYTSSDGNIVTPYDTTVFGANIVSNNCIDGQGIISFDGPVTTIGYEAFWKCSSLTSVTIPDSVTTIGDWAFHSCHSLESITIPDSVTTIGVAALYDCRRLTGVAIPDSVTTIGNSAFCYCRILTSVTIPDSVTTIGKMAFYECICLTSVTIGESVTTIGDMVFTWCLGIQEFNGKFASEDGRCLIVDGTLNSFAPAGLTEYTIPDGITKIGNYAFYYCSSLTSVTIPDSVTMIGSSAFEGCKSLTSMTIPDGVTTIGGHAFCNCTKLTSITIPDSVTKIGESAFYGCIKLISVTIPDGVTKIEDQAFQYCDRLTSVTIPDGVTKIGYHAFYDCGSLTSVYCKAITPPAGGSDMFLDNAWNRKIYVPMESVEAYKSASYWKNYASDIVGYNF